MKTLKEVTEGRKLRAMPPRWGEGRGPWKPAEFSLRRAEKDYHDRVIARRIVYRLAKASAAETFALAHARANRQLRSALLAYTCDEAFVARAMASPAWEFAEACEYALARAGEAA